MIFDPTISARFIILGISISTGVAVVAAGVTFGIIVAKQIASLQNTIVVLSPATIVLNRFVESYELPLFYDPLSSMNVLLANTQAALKKAFGEQFVYAKIESFSPTLDPLPNAQTNSSSKKRNIRQLNGNSSTTSLPIGPTTTRSTTTVSTSVLVPNNCSILVTTVNCEDQTDEVKPSCHNQTILVQNCTNTTMNIWDCLNTTVPLYNCDFRALVNDTVNCDNSTIIIPDNCSYNTSGEFPYDNTTQCVNQTNTAGQASIISSKILLYFLVTSIDSISAKDITDALTDLQPPITLFRRCEGSSTKLSSFNTALSKVEPPSKVDTSLAVITSEASISDSLQQAVSAAAEAAEVAAGVSSSGATTSGTTVITG